MAALSGQMRQGSWATTPAPSSLDSQVRLDVGLSETSDPFRVSSGGCRGGNLALVLAPCPGSERYDPGHARRRPGGAEAGHRLDPRPVAHAAELGRLEAALRVEGPHRARTGLAGTGGNGGGGPPEYLQVRAARDQGDH